jgi:hypothetical protein
MYVKKIPDLETVHYHEERKMNDALLSTISTPTQE